jgi:hypothetical protein
MRAFSGDWMRSWPPWMTSVGVAISASRLTVLCDAAAVTWCRYVNVSETDELVGGALSMRRAMS